MMVVGMYACNTAETTSHEGEGTTTDSTHVEEDHTGHDH